MSRVGKKPIKLAAGVTINFKAPQLEVKGKLGSLKMMIPPSIKIEQTGDTVNIVNTSTDPKKRALHGLCRTLIDNMAFGVANGYQKILELQGVGYKAATQGKTLVLQLGFSHPVNYDLPEGITVKVDANTKITISGSDKEAVGRIAADIRKIRPPEPYKGKGVRYAGEVITLKQGKAAGAK